MRTTFRLMLAIALIVASPMTARSVMARAAEAPAGSAAVPRFEPTRCAELQGVEWLAHANCGYLVVPEDRSRPNGRIIRLMVAEYPAQSSQKRPDPILYLEGGPGDIAPLEADPIIKANFIRDRDIWV